MSKLSIPKKKVNLFVLLAVTLFLDLPDYTDAVLSLGRDYNANAAASAAAGRNLPTLLTGAESASSSSSSTTTKSTPVKPDLTSLSSKPNPVTFSISPDGKKVIAPIFVKLILGPYEPETANGQPPIFDKISTSLAHSDTLSWEADSLVHDAVKTFYNFYPNGFDASEFNIIASKTGEATKDEGFVLRKKGLVTENAILGEQTKFRDLVTGSDVANTEIVPNYFRGDFKIINIELEIEIPIENPSGQSHKSYLEALQNKDLAASSSTSVTVAAAGRNLPTLSTGASTTTTPGKPVTLSSESESNLVFVSPNSVDVIALTWINLIYRYQPGTETTPKAIMSTDTSAPKSPFIFDRIVTSLAPEIEDWTPIDSVYKYVSNYYNFYPASKESSDTSNFIPSKHIETTKNEIFYLRKQGLDMENNYILGVKTKFRDLVADSDDANATIVTDYGGTFKTIHIKLQIEIPEGTPDFSTESHIKELQNIWLQDLEKNDHKFLTQEDGTHTNLEELEEPKSPLKLSRTQKRRLLRKLAKKKGKGKGKGGKKGKGKGKGNLGKGKAKGKGKGKGKGKSKGKGKDITDSKGGKGKKGSNLLPVAGEELDPASGSVEIVALGPTPTATDSVPADKKKSVLDPDHNCPTVGKYFSYHKH